MGWPLVNMERPLDVGHGFAMAGVPLPGGPGRLTMMVGTPVAVRDLPDPLRAAVHRPLMELLARIRELQKAGEPPDYRDVFPLVCEAVDRAHAVLVMVRNAPGCEDAGR